MTIQRSIAKFVDALAALFRIESDMSDLLHARVKALSKQIPLLFFIAIVNTLAVSYTYYGVAPDGMTVGFPLVMTVGYIARGLVWIKAGYRPPNDADARHLLKMTIILAPIASAIVFIWAIALYRYGDSYAQGHVVFYMGVTMICCIFCQMHLRPAALLMSGIMMVPFTIFLLATGRPVFAAIALSMLLVSVAMIYILLVTSRDFSNMIEFQRGLVDSQIENLRLANTDSLTSLPNRRKFLVALDDCLARAQRDGGAFVVGLIDLDRFKSVNELHGHLVGDDVLIEAGQRLRTLDGASAFFARLGSDEFGVIVDREMSYSDIQALGSRICEVLDAPFLLAGITVEISGSIGFAAFPQAGATAALLFERAAYSLTHAKQSERGRPVIFSIEHEAEIRKAAHMEECLRRADLQSEMSLHFQPIVDVERGKVVAFEALARWVSPILGRVPPDIFIRVAERSDLINKLTRVLFRSALAQAATWPEDIRVSFNLSMRDIASRDALSNIVAIINGSGISPGRIDLEVTETALIQDLDQAKVSLQTLKALGVGISLDDFGTGYSSLSYVQQFPIDKIKLDRSFVAEVETKPSCRAIVKSVIDLCRNLNLTCIVEGMETNEQVRVLRALGCLAMQGYLFGRPMPASDVLAFLDAADPPPRVTVLAVLPLAS